MAKYMLLYRGPATPMEEMTPEAGEAAMKDWNAWIARMGTMLTDVGMPLGARAAVAGDGSSPKPADVNGYSIVEAESMDAAKAACDKHPFLSTGEKKFVVDVYEMVPIEM
jgi:hypothetical protein